jgi:hypothetical protein
MTVERVVLGHWKPDTWVRFQWTGHAPEVLHDPELALELGAHREGDELVTYDLGGLRHALEHWEDAYMEDPD